MEKNVETAKTVIESGLKNGDITPEKLSRYPNMQDGLTLFYAAGEDGNSKAANLAYEAAYTPLKENLLLAQKGEGNQYNTEKNNIYGNFDYSEKKSTKLDSYSMFDILIDKNFQSFDMFDIFENIKNKDYISAVFDYFRNISVFKKVSKDSKVFSRFTCKLGSECYLKPKGLNVSAAMLEHSLQERPKDVIFYEDSDVVKKIKATSKLLSKVDEMVEAIQNNSLQLGSKIGLSFETSDDPDLYYSIHGCQIAIDNISYNRDGTKNIAVHITDTYDYTKIITAMEGEDFNRSIVSIGTLANDFGTISTKLDAINPYKVDIYFTVRR